jgi:hypothetical protein
MSEAGTQQFDASVAPMAGVAIYGQLGPQIVGSGTMSFLGRGIATLYLFFSPVGNAKASYGNNSGFPSTPLQPNVWTPIANPNNVNIAYNVGSGGDLKLVFAW